MSKQALLEKAIDYINQIADLKGEILGREVSVGNRKIDAQLLIQKGNYQRHFNLELKTQILPTHIPALYNRMHDLRPSIVIAEYISTQAKELLRNQQMSYLDTTGNFYLNDKEIYIFIETSKTSRSKLNKVNNVAFNKAGLKVIYQFLTHPEYLNKPYRFTAENALVTIDTIRRVIHGLLEDKHIVQTSNKVYQFVNREILFQEWVTAFNKKLRPKLKQNRYQPLDVNKSWRNRDLPIDTYYGGAMAAELLNDSLIADKVIIYTNKPFHELMKGLEIIPNPNGNITILEQFWKSDDHADIVHPMLIYADLINEANPRYIEAAHKIYKRHVENKL